MPVPDAGRPPAEDAGTEVDAAIDDAGLEEPPDAAEVDAGPVCAVPPELSKIQTRIFGANGQPSCDQAACHGASAAGGINLTIPLASLRLALLGDTVDPNAPERKLVVPGDPAQSRLYVIVAQRNPRGNGGPMPPTAPLTACDIETIRRWIADGAPEN